MTEVERTQLLGIASMLQQCSATTWLAVERGQMDRDDVKHLVRGVCEAIVELQTLAQSK